tara:strand:- start:39 stop:284 length:246 start_codon:yes stop_codon:yes gene_type:complete
MIMYYQLNLINNAKAGTLRDDVDIIISRMTDVWGEYWDWADDEDEEDNRRLGVHMAQQYISDSSYPNDISFTINTIEEDGE